MSSPKHTEITDPFAVDLSPEILQRANGTILLMPEDWTSKDHIYAGPTGSLAKLFKQQNAPIELLDNHGPIALRDNRSSDWIAPTFVVTQLFMTANPLAVNIAVGIIANYVTDIFKGLKSDPTVKLTIIHSSNSGKTHKKIAYEGPVSGLVEVPEILKTLKD